MLSPANLPSLPWPARWLKNSGTAAQVAGFAGAVEHGYLHQDGTAHHEINLLFRIPITDAEPAGREGHLEFRRIPLTPLADTDLRPATLEDALLGAAGDQTPFWRSWTS
jgi:hypothetical protein